MQKGSANVSYLKMSSLVQSVVTDVIASHQRLQQQQQQQQQVQLSEASGSALLDSNNNAGSDFSKEKSKQNEPVTTRSRGEKYSLRPRSFQRRSESDGDSDNAGSSSTRSGSRRGSGSGSRSKQKAPPLSKYRRKTANARERDRMREINAAFETLRRAVPHVVSPSRSHHQQESSEKLTKITTLRLAMRYITALSQALQQQQQQQQQPSSSLPQHDPLSEFFGRRLFSPETQETVRQDFPSSSINNLTLQNLTSSDLRQHQRTLENPNQTISKPLNYQGLSSSEFSQQTISPLQVNPLCTNVHSPGHKGLLSPGILQTDSSRCMNSGNLHAPRLSTSVPDKMTMTPSSLTSDHLSMQSAIVPPVLSSTSPSGITQHTMVPGLCMSTPILGSSCLVTAPEISPHCLAPVDFEEHSVEEHSSLLAATVFDDESLDSPDLDHLLIS